MAEGLIDPSNQDVGNQYFNALLLNFFFQDVERDEFDNIRKCKIYDLIHDLALSISNSETLIVDTRSVGIGYISGVHHLKIISDKKPMHIFPKDGAKKLRSLFIKDATFDESWMLKSLRTLNLEGADMEVLPSSIDKLKHLRYLDVSRSKVKAFPESIVKLYNLRILRFLECYMLEKVPKDMSNLISLRHIEFSFGRQMPGKMGCSTCLERLPIFVVGPDSNIEELECLNKLEGELRIENLEKVKGKKEAEKANLQQKTELEALRLEWTEYERESIDKNDKEVLEGLVPHPSIKSIEVENYLGEKLPSWLLMMKTPSHGDSFTVFDNLVKLKLKNCKWCEEIPRLGHLPRLKILEIEGMEKVRCIGNEFYGVDGQSLNTEWRLFPALKVFSLCDMKSLVEWRASAVDGGNAITVFPCLEELCIRSCRQLREIPIGDWSSLVKLEINGCDELSYLFDELHLFPSLKSLRIHECNELTSLPRWLQSCVSLEQLSIWWCRGLTLVKKEDLENLSCLVSFVITDCPRLSKISERMLCRLVGLTIGGFSKELDGFPYLNFVQDLPSLEDLTIHENGTMSLLPNQLQRLTALKSLCIEYFYGIEALPDWLGNLASLRSLEIFSCSNLKYLPTAEAMQRLSQLKYLFILECPLLAESCTRGSGSEWHKISHIPTIDIL